MYDIIFNNKDISIDEASRALIELTSLLSTVGEAIVELEKAYNMVKIETMQENEKMPISKVEVLAKARKEYTDLRHAQELQKSMQEVIRSLKYRQRALAGEYEAIRGQL